MCQRKKWILGITMVMITFFLYPVTVQSATRHRSMGPSTMEAMMLSVAGTAINPGLLTSPINIPLDPIIASLGALTPTLNMMLDPLIAPAMNTLGPAAGVAMPSIMISPAAPLAVNNLLMGNQGMLPSRGIGMSPMIEFMAPGPMVGLLDPMMGVLAPMMSMPSPMMGMPVPMMSIPNPMMGMPVPMMSIPNPMMGISLPMMGMPETMMSMPGPMMGMPGLMMGMHDPMMDMPWQMMGMHDPMMDMPSLNIRLTPSIQQIPPVIPLSPSVPQPTRKGGPITGTPLRVANQVPGATPYNFFEDPITCAGGPGVGMCHANKFLQWETDQHARAWTGDFMVAQYYDLARPDADLDPAVAGIKIGCVKCHSPTAYYALGDALLTTPPPRPAGIENAWNPLPGNKIEAERGIFCDFCHTLSAVGTPPLNGNYENAVTAAIDPKRGPLLPFVIPGVAPHEVIISPLHDDPMICGTCHDETSPFGMLVKGTYTEWLNSPYSPNTRCQDCHQRDALLMGLQLYSMNFKGGFSPWVEGTASVVINAPASAPVGGPLAFSIVVTNDLVGHHFPSGSEEERQLWLHVTATDAAGSVWHIPITLTPDTIDPANPNHEFWVTTNAPVAWPSPNPAIGVPIPRDTLPEGDRLYHSIFLSPANLGSVVTYAQYYSAQRFSNRLVPFVPVEELYSWLIPPNAVSPITINAELNYRRMPDSMADYLGIQRRPIILVNSASAIVSLI